MEKYLEKILKGEFDELLECDSYYHVARMRKTIDDMTVYIVVRLICLVHAKYNNDGYIPLKEKEWKNYIPIVVKASDDERKMYDLYALLTN